jgi:glycosyltransferase involved in cell wall biosynthesis
VRIFFTITNDITYDQRMQRICGSLAQHGYDVTLIGVESKNSKPLATQKFSQKRLRVIFKKGKFFYAEYNIRLFFFLMFKKIDAICAIDLDTILACLFISRLKKVPRIYDAHELFTELKEVATRPAIQRIWTKVERYAVPRFVNGYTVSKSVANELNRRYGVTYQVIRNATRLNHEFEPALREDFILYQGAVNEARGFEYLVPAMQYVDKKLVICGDGNFMDQLKQLITEYKLEQKIVLKGMLSPEELIAINHRAKLGIGLIENEGMNQYYSLANKFFDYIHAGLPQITMNYPEYREINSEFEVAVLIDGLDSRKIAAAINNLLDDGVLYKKLQRNCLLARQKLNWQQEEIKLLQFYDHHLNH